MCFMSNERKLKIEQSHTKKLSEKSTAYQITSQKFQSHIEKNFNKFKNLMEAAHTILTKQFTVGFYENKKHFYGVLVQYPSYILFFNSTSDVKIIQEVFQRCFLNQSSRCISSQELCSRPD